LSGISLVYAQLPEGFTDESIDGPWDIPVGITFDPEGFGYLWTSTGTVYFIDTTGQVIHSPVLNLSEEAASWLDHGMLGFALDPEFRQNGYVYLLYPVDRHHLLYYGTPEYDAESQVTHQATIGRLARYTLDLNNEIPELVSGSRKVLVGTTAADGFPIYSDNHGVGGLVFGNDGTLLASCGDAATATRVDNGSNKVTDYAQALEDGILRPNEDVGAFKSQLTNNLNGKLIRIDPATGAGLPSNPFYDEAHPFSAQSRVWALGLRNPWRVAHIPETGSHLPEDGQPGHFIIGDVGEGTWEEINLVQQGGQNFGWPLYEGFEAHPEYSHKHTLNLDVYNPLSGQGSCGDHFSFQSLLLAAGQTPPVESPCDEGSLIPEEVPLFVHQPPLVAYRNQAEATLPYALVASEDAQGQPASTTVEAAGIGQHFQGDASMAGVFYAGDHFPEYYHGKYFHADYRGWIRIMEYDGISTFTSIDTFHQASEKIVYLAENPNNGALYYINLEDKKLHKISYGGPPASVVKVSTSTLWGTAPLEVSFDASQSYNTQSPLQFEWDFGDGSNGTGAQINHTFDNQSSLPESFEVTLTALDTFGQTRSQALTVSINNTPPTVKIVSPADSTLYPTDETSLLRLEAAVQDMESASSDLHYEWQVFLHHNDHFHPSSSSRDEASFALISPLGCHDTDTYWYRILLSVSDPHGIEQTDEVLIFPDCEAPFMEFIYFTARAWGETVGLSWDIQHSQPIDYLEIQRSEDFLHFSSLGQMDYPPVYPGAVDVLPLTGTNVYRIKAVAENGAVRYSLPEAVSYPPDFNYTVYPNPVKGTLHIELEEAQAAEIRVQLFNVLGESVLYQKIEARYGEPLHYSLPMDQLAAGLVYLVIENGSSKVVEKVVIQP
jgi:glucose/arabinose dehydrogenase